MALEEGLSSCTLQCGSPSLGGNGESAPVEETSLPLNITASSMLDSYHYIHFAGEESVAAAVISVLILLTKH